MERWSDKVAVVTGAGSGIGAAISKELVKYGLKVVGIDKNYEAVENVSKECEQYSGRIYPRKTDICKEDEILSAFTWIKDTFGGVDILINSAGVINFTSLIALSPAVITEIFNTNVIGLSICTREAVKSMKERECEGHIININSVDRHRLGNNWNAFPYVASKHAATILTGGLRHELSKQECKIRVTSICPGEVNTPIMKKYITNLQQQESDFPWMIQPEDVAQTILFVLGTPSHVQVHELHIAGTGFV